MKYIQASETYRDQLYDYFPDNADIVDTALGQPHRAPVAGMHNTYVPYIHLNPGASTPVLYTPGFGANCVNKLQAATALASLGHEVILVGQANRKTTSGIQPKDAVNAQIRNGLAVLEHAQTFGKFDLVSHSFAGLAVTGIVQAAGRQFRITTRKPNVAMLAPSGFNAERSYTNMASRWIKMFQSEWGSNGKAFPDTTGETGKASLRTLLSRPGQTVADVRALRHETVNFNALSQIAGRIAVFQYADDEMYPSHDVTLGLDAAIQAGARVSTPVMFTDDIEPAKRLPAATHDDEQLNPWRVARPLHAFLAE